MLTRDAAVLALLNENSGRLKLPFSWLAAACQAKPCNALLVHLWLIPLRQWLQPCVPNFLGRPPHQATSSRPPAPPANEVSADDVAKVFRSFPCGAAPGPNGLQPGFLQQLVGRGGEEGRALPLIAALVNFLADGGASAGLRPYLGGAKGTALHKVSKTGGADVRPLCAGEAFGRLVGKVLLRSELPALREHLLPHQLAVGVRSGAEVVPHLYRQWQHHHSNDLDRVCLSYDEGNAHNAVDRHVFRTRMREVVPCLSHWLEYIYPTDVATNVFFHDEIIQCVAGGQQGCPFMMACHAVVQRLLLESLGAVPPLPGSSVQVPVPSPSGTVGHGALLCR